MCSELVSVSHDRSGLRVTRSGNLEEIGESSAAVLTESPLRRGSKVRINCRSNRLEGRVLSCSLVEQMGYWVEVRLAPESRWTEAWFTPEHLLKVAGRNPAQVFPLRIASGY